MKNYLCLHGHFYQPPREDPWTGIIPVQESAAPFVNWNERIAKECYGANANSRILSGDGRIIDMVNNYQYISFNFGPTLLDWLKTYAARVYQKVLDADKVSQDLQAGHGNALAQGFNHVLLPLASEEDQKTQIYWGIEHFEYHFRRKPEGFWLPETGINNITAELLVKAGIKYTVLSPWQGEAIAEKDEETFRNLGSSPVPSNKPYILETPSGDLAVFFYNPSLSQKISFEHYLHSADFLYNYILSFFKNNDETNLISAATDGEIYGHHEPFGDMCLASLIKKVQKGKTLEIINFGHYLDLFPPKGRVTLKQGEEAKGTSWSCHHGVSRWYKDCGCFTGGQEGWNQKWRTPLREAFNSLRDSVLETYINAFGALSEKDPWETRNGYIDVLIGKTGREDFAGRILKDNTPENRVRLFKLMEGLKYAQYMYTSCGWFFSDLCGLEAIQNIRYALRSLDLFGFVIDPSIQEQFLNNLQKTKSNDENCGDGRRILESRIYPYITRTETAAAELVLRRIFSLPHDPGYLFRLTKIALFGEGYDKSGQATVEFKPTDKKYQFSFTVNREARFGLSLNIRDRDNRERKVNPALLSATLRSELLCSLHEKTEKEAEEKLGDLFENLENMISACRYLHTAPPESIKTLGSFVMTSRIKKLLSASPFKSETALPELKRLFTFCETHGISFDKKSVGELMLSHFERTLAPIRTSLDPKLVQELSDLYILAASQKIPLEITIFQNSLFKFITETVSILQSLNGSAQQEILCPAVTALLADNSETSAKTEGLKRLLVLGESFGINMDSVRETLLKI